MCSTSDGAPMIFSACIAHKIVLAVNAVWCTYTTHTHRRDTKQHDTKKRSLYSALSIVVRTMTMPIFDTVIRVKYTNLCRCSKLRIKNLYIQRKISVIIHCCVAISCGEAGEMFHSSALIYSIDCHRTIIQCIICLCATMETLCSDGWEMWRQLYLHFMRKKKNKRMLQLSWIYLLFSAGKRSILQTRAFHECAMKSWSLSAMQTHFLGDLAFPSGFIISYSIALVQRTNGEKQTADSHCHLVCGVYFTNICSDSQA